MSVRKSRGEKQIAGTLNNRRSEGTGTPNSNQPSSTDTQQMTLTAGFFFFFPPELTTMVYVLLH